jgi:hypothetical protein
LLSEDECPVVNLDTEGWLLTSKFELEVWKSQSPTFSAFLLSWSGTVSYGRRQEILISKYVCVKRPHSCHQNPDLMFFGVSAFRSD